LRKRGEKKDNALCHSKTALISLLSPGGGRQPVGKTKTNLKGGRFLRRFT